MTSSTVATLECAAHGSDQDAEQGIGGDGAEQGPHHRRVLGRRERVDQDMQREQRKAEADRDAAHVLDARAPAAAKGEQPDDEQHRRRGRDVERQDLHDQRGADIGAEHDGKRRDERDHAVGRK
jgi:hypothetical protein